MPRTPEAERRGQLLACAAAVAKLAKNRKIEPVHVNYVKDDLEIRPILETVVRRWTLLTPPRYISTGAADTRGARLNHEHVVPVRVLVDRMIRDPGECRALLETAVIIADVTLEEHRRLGGIWTHHKEIYGRMLTEPISELESLGLERYRDSGIALQEAVEPAGSGRRRKVRSTRTGAEALDE